MELREHPDKFISIITHKPWTSAEEKYYSSDNEIVIGFETKVNYSELNSYNVVGDSKESVYEAYGQPDTLSSEMYTYTESQSIIVYHFAEDKVDWIKFYRLNKLTFLDRDYPKSLYEWTAK